MAGAEAKTGSSSAGLRLLSLLAALTPAPAYAGAWVAPKGGQVIWNGVAGEREESTFFESSGNWEIPIGEDNAIVAAPWMERNYDSLQYLRGEVTLSAKHVVFRDDQNVMAVQAGALWLSHPSADACSEGGAEVRWLGGRSFDGGSFVNLEAATRALEGGCEGERLDLTAGYHPADNWLAMGQVFLDAPRDGEEIVRLQASLVRFGDEGRIGLQIGLRARVDGGPQETALVIGLWGRPGD